MAIFNSTTLNDQTTPVGRVHVGFIFLVVRLVTYFKPLNVFVPAALVLLVVGFSKAIVDVIRTNAFGVGSSMVMLTGIQLAFYVATLIGIGVCMKLMGRPPQQTRAA